MKILLYSVFKDHELLVVEMTSELLKSKISFMYLKFACWSPFALNTSYSFRQNILSYFNKSEKTRKMLDVANFFVLFPVAGC